MKDRGLYWDNLSTSEFLEEVSPDENAVLNPGREFYDSGIEYFEALIQADYDGPRIVRPEEEPVKLYEGDEAVVALESDTVTYYKMESGTRHVLGEVFNSMVLGGKTRKIEFIEEYGPEDVEDFAEEFLHQGLGL